MRRPPTPKVTDLAALLSRASGLPLEEVRATMGAAGAPPPVLDPPPSRALQRALAERLEEAGEPAPPTSTPSEQRPRPRRPKRRALDNETKRGDLSLLDWQGQDFSAANELSRDARKAQRSLATVPRCYAQRVERAALGMVRQPDGTRRPTRGWAHITARRIVALAVVLWRASRTSKRHGMSRVIVGRSRGMFGTLFTNPQTGEPYSVSTFFSTWRHDGSFWDCGDVVALCRAGALWKHQPPAACAPQKFVGRDRKGIARALNEYYLTRRVCSDVEEPEPAPAPASPPSPPPAALAAAPP